MKEFKKEEFDVSKYNFSPVNSQIVLAGFYGKILVRDIDDETFEQELIYEYDNQQVNHIEFSKCGQIVGAGFDNGDAILWDITTGKSKIVFKDHTKMVQYVTFSSNCEYFATCSSDDYAYIYSMDKLELFQKFEFNKTIKKVSFTEDSQYFTFLTKDYQFAIYEKQESEFVLKE